MEKGTKVVLVTGASGGIGAFLAKSFAKEGYAVAIHYNSNFKCADVVQAKINVECPYVATMLVKADLSSEEQVIAMIAKIKSELGSVDILVNNAGIYKNGISWKLSKDAWDKVVAVNLTAPFLCTKHVLSDMRKNGWGRIINISSILGEIGTIGGCNYSASKAGLFGLTKSIAREVANKNVTVNCVVLGYFEVGMTWTLSQELRDLVIGQTPLKRFGKPEELASLILYLCTGNASFITGQLIHINGGFHV